MAKEIEFEPIGTLPIAGDEVYFIWHGAPEFHGEVDHISERGAIYTDGDFDSFGAFRDSETRGYRLRIQKRGKPEQNVPQPKQNILQEADSLTAGDRGADYGHPLDDYAKTGMIWGALLHKWSKESAASNHPIPVPPELACLMMVGVKLSREVNKHKRDNLVDGCGYLRCVEMIHERKGHAPPT